MLNWSLYQDSFSTSTMRDVWSESRTIETWLQVEKTLADCQSKLDLIPVEAASQLQQISIDQLDQPMLIEEMNLVGRPIVGLVKQLRTLVGNENGQYIHYKTTTQDIMDTAMVLQMKLGLANIVESIDRSIALLVDHANKHKDTSAMGRTNGQYAIAIKFSTKFLVWIAELQRRITALKQAAKRGIIVQIGGPVGDLCLYENDAGTLVKANVAEALGLGTVEPHWQNARDGIADIITALGALCATLCKIAHNINLLSSSDIGELSEDYKTGKGVSSSMAHKKNQRATEYGEAVARLGRQRSEQINEVTLHEHERSGGVWIAEWVIVPEVFLLTSGALMWNEQTLDGLKVHKKIMESNIGRYKHQKIR
ncbi:MAG: lyase family protein [Granulosicoccaceae bacterium]